MTEALTTPSAPTKATGKAWLIWSLGAIFYAYEFLLQVSPNVMQQDLMRAFGITAAGLGQLGALYFYAYAGMQIPVGVMLDRLGPRRLLTIAALLCAIGSFFFGTAESFAMAGIGRFLIGLGSAFAVVSCFKVGASWFPPKRFSLIVSLTIALGMLGAAVGQSPLAFIVDYLGWRQTVLLFGAIGAVLAVFLWTIVRDRPEGSEEQGPALYADANEPLLSGLKKVMAHRKTWIAAIYGGLMFAPTTVMGAMWGGPFLMRAYDLSRTEAGFFGTLLFLGWAAGAPFGGALSDHMGRRKPMMIYGAFSTLIVISTILYVPNLPLPLLGTLMFLLGITSSGFLPVFALVKEFHPTRISATAMGFMNMINMIGGALIQPFVGWLLDFFWNGAMHDGIREFSVQSYQYALSSLPIGLAIALCLTPFVTETYCRPQAE